jgi:cytoskeletal protein CcmA (bactofilin family)
MALFNKEPDKNVRPPQPAARAPGQPAPSATLAVPAGATDDKAAANRASNGQLGPVTTASDSRAYLDKGCRISGKLFFEGATRIDGQVDGEITASSLVTIGESAVVTAQIKAASVVVAGKVSGDITASERIEIRPSAKVLGNLTGPILIVHEGAIFEGHCSMGQPEAQREQSKVAMFPKEDRNVQAGTQKTA